MEEYTIFNIDLEQCSEKLAFGPQDKSFMILCATHSDIHQVKLTLSMSESAMPNTDCFELCFQISGTPYYRAIRKEETLGDCCMSGCTGCPTFERAQNSN